MDIEEKLICLVQKNNCIYDIKSRFYSDKVAKQNAWEKISKEIGISAALCMSKWTRIRDNYRKGLKSREQKSGAGAAKRRPLKFEKELTFLKSFFQEHSQISNIHSPDNIPNPESRDTSRDSPTLEDNIYEDIEAQFSPPASTRAIDRSPSINVQSPANSPSQQSQESMTNQPKETVSNVLKKYLESKAEKDPVSMFFLTMAENVKKLPDRLQLEVRQKVFSVVSDAELQWLNERDSERVNRGYFTRPHSSSYTTQTPPIPYVQSSLTDANTATTSTYIPSNVARATTPTYYDN